MNKYPKSVLVFGGVLAISILVGIGVVITRYYTAPERVNKRTDQDTGQTLYEEPNKTPEVGSQQEIIILGTPILFDNGVTQAQFKIIETNLINYTKSYYDTRYEIIKILPDTFKNEASSMTFSVKLGESQNLYTAEVKLPNIYSIQILMSDTSGANKFDSGVITTEDDYTGDGVPPEKQRN